MTDSHMPMTNPDAALAIHHGSWGHSLSWVELEANGELLMIYGGGKVSTSSDRGITWGEPWQAVDENGDDLAGTNSLVRLDDGGLGVVVSQAIGDGPYDRGLAFRSSDDGGRTWSQATPLLPPGAPAFVWQDMALRTSSGRIVVPCYGSIGQGTSHQEGTPFVGGFVNGNFVSSDAHFYDPHLGFSYVCYSDDGGHTWSRSEGDLLVLEASGAFHGACEPSVAEIGPGHLLMLMRTNLGRYFQAWSHDDGATWTRPQPSQLAGTHAPAQVRRLPNGHLLCVFTQHSREEIRRGFIRTRLSAAISRSGGKMWEHFQNVESIHPEPHVVPGPIEVHRPDGAYTFTEDGHPECDPTVSPELPVGYGRWSYPSVLVLDDRVLIVHTYSYHDEKGERRGPSEGTNAKMKVLPMSWFYGGSNPYDNAALAKLERAAEP